ncbi:hypothetical protein JCM10213_007080 [Rhodosporidiobolus nylandii]
MPAPVLRLPFLDEDPSIDYDKPLPDIPLRKRASKHFLGALKRLPRALQGRREEGGLQRRPAVRIKVQRRETFIMQTAHSNPQHLPDPAFLGNRMLVGARDRHSLARAQLLAHVHPLAPIPEDTPFADAFVNGSSSTFASSTPSLSDGASSIASSSSSAPSFEDPTASPISWFSDDSADEDEEEGGRMSECEDDELDFPEDEDDAGFDDEDLTSDLDIGSFVSELEDERRWSSIFGMSSPSTCSSSSASIVTSSRPCSPASFASLPTPLDTIAYVSPRVSTSSTFATFERDFRSRPLPLTNLQPGVSSDGTFDLSDFAMILTEEPPSPQRRKFRRASLPHPPLATQEQQEQRRGSTKTL